MIIRVFPAGESLNSTTNMTFLTFISKKHGTVKGTNFCSIAIDLRSTDYHETDCQMLERV